MFFDAKSGLCVREIFFFLCTISFLLFKDGERAEKEKLKAGVYV